VRILLTVNYCSPVNGKHACGKPVVELCVSPTIQVTLYHVAYSYSGSFNSENVGKHVHGS